MSILAAIKGAQTGAKLLAAVAAIGGVGLIVFLAFMWGKNDQKAEHAEKQMELTKQYASDLSGANAAAYARGRDSLKQEMENNGKLEDIIADALAAEGAGNLCLSADLVERLRQLQ